jgi:hypothetical protein
MKSITTRARSPRNLGDAQPSTGQVVAFIGAHKDDFGVQPIMEELRDAGLPIASSTYYAVEQRRPSRRALRDAELKELIVEVYTENFRVYGARRIWKELARQAPVGHAANRPEVVNSRGSTWGWVGQCWV